MPTGAVAGRTKRGNLRGAIRSATRPVFGEVLSSNLASPQASWIETEPIQTSGSRVFRWRAAGGE
jgi:hypothetical protein